VVVQVIQVRKYAGSDGPVVVLHGGPGAAGSLAGLAMTLAPDCEVWEPLQRRSGEVPLTVDRHVADLHDIAPDPATIVGHSWGRCSDCRTRRVIRRRCERWRSSAAVRTTRRVGPSTNDVSG
jgi:pimeloyl-ACP methyl ester carboxylesterase